MNIAAVILYLLFPLLFKVEGLKRQNKNSGFFVTHMDAKWRLRPLQVPLIAPAISSIYPISKALIDSKIGV